MAHSVNITVVTEAKTRTVTVEEGTTLLEGLHGIYDFHIDASCGGKGTCGKCKVLIREGNDTDIQDAERKFLSPDEIRNGYRLACQYRLHDTITVVLDGTEKAAQIVSHSKKFSGKHDPVIKKKYLLLSEPSLSDQRDDLSRVCNELESSDVYVPLSLKRGLPSLLRDSDYHVTAVFSGDTLIAVEKGDTCDKNYGIAVDIGTTTIVVHLLDFSSGNIIDTVSGLNRQKILGADVISRIEYCITNSHGLDTLHHKIVEQLGEMILDLLKRNSIPDNRVYSVMVAGNTTMLHLLAGIDPSGIATAPFTPGFLGRMSHPSQEFGDFPFHALISFIPSISGYVGGDIVAGILASGMHKREEFSILIDVGTNGEIALGNKDQLFCCSTAAGPAFEGAHISCGMGGISGALDTLHIDSGILSYTTIHDTQPVGICGSGIIDTVAALLESGIVDSTGRILDQDEIEAKPVKNFMKERLIEKDGPALLLVEASKSGTNENIIFTQKDIREVQLAKAAIAAGVATLIHEAGISLEDIGHLFIAGGFGSYISRESAALIGLIPAELLNRTEFIGNTAGQGAIECSFSREQYSQCDTIVSLTKYIELSSNVFFQGKYMECMIFPEETMKPY